MGSSETGGGGFEEIEEADEFAEDVDVGSFHRGLSAEGDFFGGVWTNLWVFFCCMVELRRRRWPDKRVGEAEAESDARSREAGCIGGGG